MGLLPLLVFLFGMYGSCSTDCPVNSRMGPDQGCWYDISNAESWVEVNSGELRVRLQTDRDLTGNSASKHQTLSQAMYRFWFVRDPKVEVINRQYGRIGTWKLHIMRWIEQTNPHELLLSWQLRDPRPSLRNDETIGFAITGIENGKRVYRILKGEYDTTNHRVKTRLPAKYLDNMHTYLIPIRYRLSSITSHHQTASNI
jgi:hypothetical protein